MRAGMMDVCEILGKFDAHDGDVLQVQSLIDRQQQSKGSSTVEGEQYSRWLTDETNSCHMRLDVLLCIAEVPASWVYVRSHLVVRLGLRRIMTPCRSCASAGVVGFLTLERLQHQMALTRHHTS